MCIVPRYSASRWSEPADSIARLRTPFGRGRHRTAANWADVAAFVHTSTMSVATCDPTHPIVSRREPHHAVRSSAPARLKPRSERHRLRCVEALAATTRHHPRQGMRSVPAWAQKRSDGHAPGACPGRDRLAVLRVARAWRKMPRQPVRSRSSTGLEPSLGGHRRGARVVDTLQPARQRQRQR